MTPSQTEHWGQTPVTRRPEEALPVTGLPMPPSLPADSWPSTGGPRTSGAITSLSSFPSTPLSFMPSLL